jgi:PucR family transcriptional regulator, purine catabolism regulatory protein
LYEGKNLAGRSYWSTKARYRGGMADEVLHVQDIVATTSLDVSVLAGAGGLNREVLWAHSCEMQDPARFLSPHELLMTVGLCVPTEAAEQVAFLARLDDAGLAGFMIGDHAPAPVLSREMLDEADRRDFPMLLAGEHTAYAVVARHVAAANWSTQSLQVMRLSKLYHAATYAEGNLDSLVREIVTVLRVGLSVIDDGTGVVLADVGFLTEDDTEAVHHRYPLRGAHPASVVVTEYPGEQLDAFLLVHVTKMVQLAADNVLTAAERKAGLGASAISALLNGSVPDDLPRLLHPSTTAHGFRAVAFPLDNRRSVSLAAALANTSALIGTGRTHALALVPLAELDGFRKAAELAGCRAGVSSTFSDPMDYRAAATEAVRVFLAYESSERTWSEFEGSTLSVLTRSRLEAAEIVSGVLGPLAEESEQATVLRETLFAYLRNDRSWVATAAELAVHRQTLAYRLKRITAETGRDVGRTPDLSAFWIACQAWEVLHPNPVGAPAED